MQTSQEKSNQVVEKVQSANTYIDEIVASVSTINQKNLQISTAANEQTTVAQEISNLVIDVTNIAESNSAESTAAGNISNGLQAMVDRLDKASTYFKI